MAFTTPRTRMAPEGRYRWCGYQPTLSPTEVSLSSVAGGDITSQAFSQVHELRAPRWRERAPLAEALGRAPSPDYRLPYWTPFMREDEDAAVLIEFRQQVPGPA